MILSNYCYYQFKFCNYFLTCCFSYYLLVFTVEPLLFFYYKNFQHFMQTFVFTTDTVFIYIVLFTLKKFCLILIFLTVQHLKKYISLDKRVVRMSVMFVFNLCSRILLKTKLTLNLI